MIRAITYIVVLGGLGAYFYLAPKPYGIIDGIVLMGFCVLGLIIEYLLDTKR